MVFGSAVSGSSWEPFRRAIKSLSEVFANRPNLVQKHKKYLDMIGWAELDPDTPITPTFACEINKGIFTADGTKKNLPAHIYVDDALLLGRSKQQILMRLATLVEARVVVMGEPDTLVRQCPLAMDKWFELIVDQSRQCLD